MFTQPISMDCTFEQYQKFLKEPLKEIGYKEWLIGKDTNSWRDIILTNHGDSNDRITDLQREYCSNYNCTYLGSFNAPLFLALAAMTDKAKGNYGEYFIGKYTGDFYIVNDVFRRYINISNVRKATKEEIIDWFKDDTQDLSESPIYFHRNQSGSNDGLRVQNIDLAIKILKSKGYKILKPKTWEEV